MSKRALGFLLAFIITTSIFTASVLAAQGEEIPDGSAPSYSADGSENGASDPSVSAPPNTVSTARFPALSVSVISNYFGKTNADYNEYTKEFTVRFTLQSSKALLSLNWALSYDSEILKVDPAKNTVDSICPIMSKTASVSFDDQKGLIEYNATDLNMYDFTIRESDFVKIVFDVPELTPNDTEITKVDLSVDELWVSEPDAKTGLSLSDKEVCLVKNGKVMNNAHTKDVSVSKQTLITPSTFHDSNINPSTKDEKTTTTIKPTEKPTAAATTAPSPDDSQKNNNAKINTGEWYIALIILLMLLICSIVLFVLRKRDIYNN